MERYQEITYNMKESLFLKVIHLNSGRLTAHKIGNINLKKYAVRFLMEDIYINQHAYETCVEL